MKIIRSMATALFLVFSAMILLSGCGGGSSTPAPATSDTVTVNTDADWAAYQVGPTDPWTVVDSATLATGTFTFDVDQTGKYGVAFHDPSSNEIDIFQFTRNEISTLNDFFQTNQFSVTGTISGLVAGEVAGVYASQFEAVGVTGAYGLSSVDEGVRDIFAVAIDGTGTPLRFKAIRGQLVDQNLTNIDIDLSTGTSPLSGFNVTITGGEANFAFVTSNNTVVSQDSTTAGAGMYYAAAASDAVAGDHYLFMGEEPSSLPTKMFLRTIDATVAPADFTFDYGNIDPFTGAAPSSATYPLYSGLSYTPNPLSPPLKAFMVMQDQGSIHWEAVASAGWLETATTYQLPDLSTLANFPASSGFVTGTQIDWTVQAIMADKTAQELTDAEDMLFVNDLTMEMAAVNGSFTP